MAVRLNLGSGDVPLAGFINVDALFDASGVDLVADINERLPFNDAQVDMTYASHILEHFATPMCPGFWRSGAACSGLAASY